MGFYKSKWLNEYNFIKPKFNLRYVDDILAAFDNEQDSINFLIKGILTLNLREKLKLTMPLLFLMFLCQLSIIKFSQFIHIINRPMQVFS